MLAVTVCTSLLGRALSVGLLPEPVGGGGGLRLPTGIVVAIGEQHRLRHLVRLRQHRGRPGQDLAAGELHISAPVVPRMRDSDADRFPSPRSGWRWCARTGSGSTERGRWVDTELTVADRDAPPAGLHVDGATRAPRRHALIDTEIWSLALLFALTWNTPAGPCLGCGTGRSPRSARTSTGRHAEREGGVSKPTTTAVSVRPRSRW
jgi:hypothetical protein